MKKIIVFALVAVFATSAAWAAGETNRPAKYHEPIKIEKKWKKYFPGKVDFRIESPEKEGAEIYRSIIPDPDKYISENALRVLQTLYKNPKDKAVPEIKTIEYVVRDFDGISYKSGGGDNVRIDYSTRWIEHSFANNDTLKLDYETRGVIYHELTHAYQLEPKGCGHYDGHSEYWAFIEGLADAVRVACGCFDQDFAAKDRPRGGSWMSGYRITGYFLFWLQKTKDKNFIRKFNRSAVELDTWSWDAAMHHILGDSPKNDVQTLWNEYQHAVGDDLLPADKKQPAPKPHHHKKADAE